jgi:monoamine oxidase
MAATILAVRRPLTCVIASLALAALAVGPAGCGRHRAVASAPPTVAPAVAGPTAGEGPRVVVVGGGVAGLVSAYELAKRGISVQLLEASDSWGGRVATITYGPDTYAEAGLQEMWAGNPLLEVARALSVPLDRKVERPFSSVVLDGKLVPYTQSSADAYFASFLEPGERKALTGWMRATQALRDRALAARAGLDPDLERVQSLSFADWVATFHLPRRVTDWIRLTLECELAADWTAFSGLSGVLELGFFLGDGVPNYHVRGGSSRLVEALVAAIERNGGHTTLSATVTTVDRWTTPDGRVRARVSYLRDHRLESVEAERVILAVPFVRLHQLRLDPPLSADKWQALLTLGRGQYVVVHLLVDRRARDSWLVNGRSPFPVLTDGPLGVVYGVMHESPPAASAEVFSLLIHGAPAAAFHMIPREVKLRELLGALDRLWPGLSTHVRGSEVFTYHPAALPVWPPGRSPLDKPAAALRAPELGLYLAGDYTLGAHSDAAAESGLAAAAQVSAALGAPSRSSSSPSAWSSSSRPPPAGPPPAPPAPHR